MFEGELARRSGTKARRRGGPPLAPRCVAPVQPAASRLRACATTRVLDWDAGRLAEDRQRRAFCARHRDRTPGPCVARIVGISLSVANPAAAYIPLRHGGPARPDQLPVAEVLAPPAALARGRVPAQTRPERQVRQHVFANHGIAGRGWRTTPCSRATCSRRTNQPRTGLAWRAHLNRTACLRDVCGKGRADPASPGRHRSAPRIPGEGCWRCALRAPAAVAADRPRGGPALRLRADRDARLARDEDGAARRADRRALLPAQSDELGASSMLALEQQAARWPGSRSTWPQPKQIGEILFGKLAAAGRPKTASGAPSTDEPSSRSWRRRLIRCRQDPRLPRPVQAEEHLHRQAAADGQPGDRRACTPTTRRRWR